MPQRLVIGPLDAPSRAAVLARYNDAPDPETRSRFQMAANPTERVWQPMRRRLTHNSQRANILDLYADTERYFESLDAAPDTVLRRIGSPYAITHSIHQQAA